MQVSLYVWRVPRVLPAFLRMAFEPRGPGFVKFLGTSDGFGPRDGDLTRWAAIAVGPPRSFPGWDRIAVASARVDLTPLASRGTWSGVAPFGAPAPARTDGMVLALTRARLRPTRALAFWRAIAPVAAEVHDAPGLLARFGVGEAPIGWQGTVSVWRGSADLTAFAYRQPEHRAVIARTPTDRWYAEELFARFAVQEISGDLTVLDWREGGA